MTFEQILSDLGNFAAIIFGAWGVVISVFLMREIINSYFHDPEEHGDSYDKVSIWNFENIVALTVLPGVSVATLWGGLIGADWAWSMVKWSILALIIYFIVVTVDVSRQLRRVDNFLRDPPPGFWGRKKAKEQQTIGKLEEELREAKKQMEELGKPKPPSRREIADRIRIHADIPEQWREPFAKLVEEHGYMVRSGHPGISATQIENAEATVNKLPYMAEALSLAGLLPEGDKLTMSIGIQS